MRYSIDVMTNITRNSTHIQFSVAHTWAGPSTITADCLQNKGKSLQTNLSDIANFVPQYSRSDYAGLDHAKFRDVCLEFEKFLYFVQVSGERPAVQFDDGSLRFEMLRWPLDAYLNHKKVNATRRTCFLVAQLEQSVWKMILLTMVPLAISVDAHTIGDKDPPLFIFRKRIPPESHAALRILSLSPPVKLDDIMCFDTLLMTRTYSRLDDRENRLRQALQLDIGPLRRRLEKVTVKRNRVVLCENLWDALEVKLKDKFPELDTVRLNGNEPVQNVMEMVGSARMLIGDHIMSLIHMLRMDRQGGCVVDVTPPHLACNLWAKQFADKVGVKYIRET
jgi:hypothetical protein